MPTEHAAVRVVHKPWGVGDLQPWSNIDGSGDAVGELWFERADKDAPTPALLLKLLFTSEPLSIQVHPDDTFARAMGMPNGKSEAWYILSAQPDAQIGAGLKHQVTPQQLRASIQDGSIAELDSLATGYQRRRHLHPGRHHPRHRRRHRARRNSAAQRRDIPPVRLWPAARIARRQRGRRCPPMAASNALQSDGALPRTERFSSRASISFSSALNFLRVQAGRCLPNRRPGCSFSTATRQSDWPRHRSGKPSSLAAAAPASRSATMD